MKVNEKREQQKQQIYNTDNATKSGQSHFDRIRKNFLSLPTSRLIFFGSITLILIFLVNSTYFEPKLNKLKLNGVDAFYEDYKKNFSFSTNQIRQRIQRKVDNTISYIRIFAGNAQRAINQASIRDNLNRKIETIENYKHTFKVLPNSNLLVSEESENSQIVYFNRLLKNNKKPPKQLEEKVTLFNSIEPLFTELVHNQNANIDVVSIIGSVGQSFIRVYPPLTKYYDPLEYPGYDETDFWKFFSPIITPFWEQFLFKEEDAPIIYLPPYEGAWSNKIAIDFTVPLYTRKKDSIFGGVIVSQYVNAREHWLESNWISNDDILAIVDESGNILDVAGNEEQIGIKYTSLSSLPKVFNRRVLQRNFLGSINPDVRSLAGSMSEEFENKSITLGNDQYILNKTALSFSYPIKFVGKNGFSDKLYLFHFSKSPTTLFPVIHALFKGLSNEVFIFSLIILFFFAALVALVFRQSISEFQSFRAGLKKYLTKNRTYEVSSKNYFSSFFWEQIALLQQRHLNWDKELEVLQKFQGRRIGALKEKILLLSEKTVGLENEQSDKEFRFFNPSKGSSVLIINDSPGSEENLTTNIIFEKKRISFQSVLPEQLKSIDYSEENLLLVNFAGENGFKLIMEYIENQSFGMISILDICLPGTEKENFFIKERNLIYESLFIPFSAESYRNKICDLVEKQDYSSCIDRINKALFGLEKTPIEKSYEALKNIFLAKLDQYSLSQVSLQSFSKSKKNYIELEKDLLFQKTIKDEGYEYVFLDAVSVVYLSIQLPFELNKVETQFILSFVLGTQLLMIKEYSFIEDEEKLNAFQEVVTKKDLIAAITKDNAFCSAIVLVKGKNISKPFKTNLSYQLLSFFFLGVEDFEPLSSSCLINKRLAAPFKVKGKFKKYDFDGLSVSAE